MIRSSVLVDVPEPASVAAGYSVWADAGWVVSREVAGVPIVSLAGDRRSTEWAEQHAAVLLAAAADARRRAGMAELVLGARVRRRAYCDGCASPVCAVGAEDPCPGCCECLGRCLEAAEQPDGIDPDSHDLPDAARAAVRVEAYVSSCGDGVYDTADGNPLYARDLHALAREADRWRRIAVRLALAGDGSFRLLSTSDRDSLETGLAAYRQEAWDRADRLADLTDDSDPEDAAAQGGDR